MLFQVQINCILQLCKFHPHDFVSWCFLKLHVDRVLFITAFPVYFLNSKKPAPTSPLSSQNLNPAKYIFSLLFLDLSLNTMNPLLQLEVMYVLTYRTSRFACYHGEQNESTEELLLEMNKACRLQFMPVAWTWPCRVHSQGNRNGCLLSWLICRFKFLPHFSVQL